MSYRNLVLSCAAIMLFSSPLYADAQSLEVEIKETGAAAEQVTEAATDAVKEAAEAAKDAIDAIDAAEKVTPSKDASKSTEIAPAPLAVPAAPPPPVQIKPRSPSRRISNDVIVSEDGKSLHLVGDLLSGISKRLREVLEENPDAETLVLSSDGGLVLEGLAIGNIIAKKGLNTHVEMVCASACTLAFLKGKARSISKSGILGFHQSSRRSYFGRRETRLEGAGNIVMADAYRAAGANEFIIENALRTRPSKMWFVGGKKISKNIENVGLVDDGSVAVPARIWQSASDLRVQLTRNSLWKMAAKKRPDYFYPAISEIWTKGILSKDEDKALESGYKNIKAALLSNVMHLSDEDTLELLQLEHDIWAEFTEKRNKNCIGMGQRKFPNSKALTEEQKIREEQIQAKIFAVPFDVDMPSDEMMYRAEARVMEFWAIIMAATDYQSHSVKYKFCSSPKVFYEQLMALPPAQRAQIYRALLTPDIERRNLF